MSESVIDKNVLQEAIALGQKLGAPNMAEGLEIPYAIVPAGCQVSSLLAQKYPYGLPPRKPDHIKTTVSLTNAASFCAYVKLYADAHTRIFGNPEEFSFRAVLDYHGASNTPNLIPDGSGTPAPTTPSTLSAEFMDHNAIFNLRKSEQWNVWIARNEKEIPQVEFAEFIEDNCADIVDPKSAIMLQIARELTAHMDVNFASKVTPKNGTTQFAYTEVLTTGQPGQSGNMEVPDKFTILIPIFYGEQLVTVEARLRFRINSGKLKFIFKLYRPAELLSDAFNLASARIRQDLDMDILLGSI